MSEFIKAAVLEYNIEAIYGVNPISLTDSQIIIETISIIKKLKGSKDLIGLLKNYKDMSDSDMLDSLIELNDSIEEISIKEDTKDFLRFQGQTFALWGLAHITTETCPSPYSGEIEFRIWFNRAVESKTLPFSDICFSFKYEETRDGELKKLTNKLTEFTNIRFI